MAALALVLAALMLMLSFCMFALGKQVASNKWVDAGSDGGGSLIHEGKKYLVIQQEDWKEDEQ